MAKSGLVCEIWAIEKVRPYENNPRLNEGAVAAVAQSIKTFGLRKPIVVDKSGVIICGHTTRLAALELGLKEVSVHVARDLSPEKVKAYRIADNKTGELAEWDWDKLTAELLELKADDVDLTSLGFDADELATLVNELREGLVDPDEVPALPDKARTKPGDVYILGDHRLLCGDSSKRADVDRLLGGRKVQLVNTDPPYNVKVESRTNNAIAAGLSSGAATNHQKADAARNGRPKPTDKKLRAKDRPLMNDFVDDAEFDRLLTAWFENLAYALDPGRGFYVWGGFSNCANYPAPLAKAGLYFSQAIIWVKNQPVMTRKDFFTAHEWCFYGWREGKAHEFFGKPGFADVWYVSRSSGGTCDIGRGLRIEAADGSRIDVMPPNDDRKLRQLSLPLDGVAVTMLNAPTDVWHVKKVPGQKMVHLTEKPVELAIKAINFSSRPGERVLDFFGGSGSTLIACEQTGRHALLMELDPLYCDVIVERWEKFTGKKARKIPAAPPEAKKSKPLPKKAKAK